MKDKYSFILNKWGNLLKFYMINEIISLENYPKNVESCPLFFMYIFIPACNGPVVITRTSTQ